MEMSEQNSENKFIVGMKKALNVSSRETEPNNEIGLCFWCCILTFIIACYSLAMGLQSNCPSVSYSNTESPFLENNAYQILKEAIKMSLDRHVGSEANEIEMPLFLKAYLGRYLLSGNYSIELSEQMSQGLLQSNWFLYRNIRNIALRVVDSREPSSTPKSAILVNCHYDSAMGAPGASDNFVNCAILMEIIRVLHDIKPPLRHDIIFLFNGAEEMYLTGSHLFVSQHKWWRDVKTFVNLEAAGSGGRLMMFQVDKPWLVQLYSESSASPFGSVYGQEIFEAELIPSDTDYRIFKSMGRVSGIDMAYIQNGYVYHTMHDTAKFISPNCVKNSGANLYNFLLKLANSPYVTDPKKYNQGDLIYFDYLGLFMVHYSATFATILNVGSCIYVFIRFVIRIVLDKLVLKHDFLAILSHLIFLVFMLVLNVITAYLMDIMNMKMTWYSNRLNTVGLYVIPVMFLFFVYHKSLRFWPSNLTAERSHFEAGKCLISVFTLITTMVGIKSSYILMLWLLFPSVLELLLNLIEDKLTKVSYSYQSAIKYMLMFAIPLLYTFYLANSIFEVFIPIMGRSPHGPKPDFFISILVTVIFILPALTFSGKVYTTRVKTLRFIRFSLLYVMIIYAFVLAFSNFGFPFNSSDDFPRKQRLSVRHINRVFYNDSNQVTYSDSGLAVSSLDQIQFHHLKIQMQELRTTKLVSTCFNFSSAECHFNFDFDYRYYLKRMSHSFGSDLRLKLVKKRQLDKSLWNITLSLTGPSYMTLVLKFSENIKFLRISIPVRFSESDLIYFYYLHGTKPDTPVEFWLLARDINVYSNVNSTIDYFLEGSYIDSKNGRSHALEQFLKELPSWVVPATNHACYKTGKFIL